jgi:serine/threonine protein kinase
MTTGTNERAGMALIGDRYLITDKLGEGGMGAVYRALDRNLDADVVIKLPLRSMLEDKDFAHRFEVEIRSLAKLSHPHIVKVTDVGLWDDLPFAVMQFLPGGSLEERRPAGPDGPTGTLDPKDLGRWLPGIAQALDYVHTRGYVHRDVKPANILFDAHGHSFLSDFGVVKVLASSADARTGKTVMTGAGMVVGTPEYMAPEIIMGEAFDGRADQYALAVTVYEMLAGVKPFEDETKTRILVLHTTKPPPPLCELCSWIPESLSNDVLRALAKDPKERYENCAVMAAQIIATVTTALANKPERIRFKCPSCGKSLRIAPNQVEQLRQIHRPIPCPQCQTLIPVTRKIAKSDERTSPLVATEGGTMVVTPQRPSGTFPTNLAPKSTPPTPLQGSTAVWSSGAVASGSNLQTGEAPAKLRSATVVERAKTVVERANTAVERPKTVAEVVPIRDLPQFATAKHDAIPSVRDAKPASVPLAVWIGIGGAVAVSVLGMAVLVFWLALQRSDNAGTESSKTTIALNSTVPKLAPLSAAPNRKSASASSTSNVMRSSDSSSRSSADNAPDAQETNEPSPVDSAPPSVSPSPPNAQGKSPGTRFPAPPRSQSASSPSTGGNTPESPAIDDDDAPPPGTNRTMSTLVSLRKIRENPQQFANQTAELDQLYCILAHSQRNDGTYGISVVDARLDLTAEKIVVQTRKNLETLDMDPEAARKFNEHERMTHPTAKAAAKKAAPITTADRLAVLTVKVIKSRGPAGESWTPRVVKLEFFKEFNFTIDKRAMKRLLHIAFRTVTITPSGAMEGLGNPDEWKRLERLGHVTLQMKKLFARFENDRNQARWMAISRQMDSMISQGIRNSIGTQAEMQRQARRAVGLP